MAFQLGDRLIVEPHDVGDDGPFVFTWNGSTRAFVSMVTLSITPSALGLGPGRLSEPSSRGTTVAALAERRRSLTSTLDPDDEELGWANAPLPLLDEFRLPYEPEPCTAFDPRTTRPERLPTRGASRFLVNAPDGTLLTVSGSTSVDLVAILPGGEVISVPGPGKELRAMEDRFKGSTIHLVADDQLFRATWRGSDFDFTPIADLPLEPEFTNVEQDGEGYFHLTDADGQLWRLPPDGGAAEVEHRFPSMAGESDLLAVSDGRVVASSIAVEGFVWVRGEDLVHDAVGLGSGGSSALAETLGHGLVAGDAYGALLKLERGAWVRMAEESTVKVPVSNIIEVNGRLVFVADDGLLAEFRDGEYCEPHQVQAGNLHFVRPFGEGVAALGAVGSDSDRRPQIAFIPWRR